VRYLLEHGGDFKFMTPYGLSALEFAILPGYYEIAMLIYERTKEKLRPAE
jgi:ankyrin repeat protein